MPKRLASDGDDAKQADRSQLSQLDDDDGASGDTSLGADEEA
jgi:hypothetical protein